MPKVYANSIDMALCKYPVEGEQEMLEPHEDVDLTGDVKLARDIFVEWCNSVTGTLVQHPCAMIVQRYAADQQGIDLRGGVSGDTAWELCCRLLSTDSTKCKLGTRDIFQLLVYWL